MPLRRLHFPALISASQRSASHRPHLNPPQEGRPGDATAGGGRAVLRAAGPAARAREEVRLAKGGGAQTGPGARLTAAHLFIFRRRQVASVRASRVMQNPDTQTKTGSRTSRA